MISCVRAVTVQIFNEGILQLIVLSGKVLKYAIDGLLNAIASIPIGQQKRKPEPCAVKRRPNLIHCLNNHVMKRVKPLIHKVFLLSKQYWSLTPIPLPIKS